MGDRLSDLDVQLQGVTQMAVPYVSKDVMVGVLREHNTLMASVKHDIVATNAAPLENGALASLARTAPHLPPASGEPDTARRGRRRDALAAAGQGQVSRDFGPGR
mgnify:CR=1 FL=1